MIIRDLITTLRTDYLDDDSRSPLWDDESLLRKIREAQKQACNRVDFIYDDATLDYCRITLVSGVATYSIDPIITKIERVLFESKFIELKSREELDANQPTWRTDTGMTGNTISMVITGRKLRVTPLPTAADAGKFIYLEVFRLPDTPLKNVNQELEIPEENQRDLIYWVLHECYKKQDADTYDQERSDYYLTRFNQAFGEPVPALIRQHQFESPKSLTHLPPAYVKSTVAEDQDIWG